MRKEKGYFEKCEEFKIFLSSKNYRDVIIIKKENSYVFDDSARRSSIK